MNRAEKIEIIELMEEIERRASRNKLKLFYPETGPLRRELYIPHQKFF